MKKLDTSGRFAERVLRGVDDAGVDEHIVNPQHRASDAPRPDDYVFEGFELDDCLEAANAALEDDVRVLEEDGMLGERVLPFTRDELLKPLEQWFFGHR